MDYQSFLDAKKSTVATVGFDVGNLVTVATNGHTLSQSQGAAIEGLTPVIIPRKTISLLKKTLTEYIGNIRVVSVDNKIQFTIGNLVISSKVIDGTFPDYKRIVPVTYKDSFKIETQDAIKSIERLLTIEDKVSNSIKLTVANGTLTFDRIGTDENATDQVDAEYAGPEFVIHINSQYISETLNKIRTGKTIVQFNDPSTAILFTAENDDKASWLVMPTRGR